MTLPKLLQEKRDELAKRRSSFQSSSGCKLTDEVWRMHIEIGFEDGFDEACDLLIPEIEKLHNMLWETRNDMVLIHNLLLDYYSEENVYFHNPEYAFNKAKESLDRLKALQSIEEFLNGK